MTAGACSVLEWSYLRHVERAHGLPTADRQVRASARGTVCRDVWYRRFRLVVELTVRLGIGQLLSRSCRTARTLDRLLRRRGSTGRMRPCPRCPPEAAGD